MTNIIRKCPKCNEVIYRFKKGERPSQVVLGAEMWLHLLMCDRDAYDDLLLDAWNK
jgi:hypothetical protein